MKYFQFIRNVVLLVLLGTLAGCQNDELIVDMGQGQDKIVLSFSDAGHSMTRVSSQEDYTTPTDVEKAVTHIDVFVLKNDMIDYYERISTGGADDKVILIRMLTIQFMRWQIAQSSVRLIFKHKLRISLLLI